MRARGLEIAPGINVDAEFDSFLAYSRAEGKVHENWEAAFERWCHKKKEFTPGGIDTTEGNLSREEKFDRHARKLGIPPRQTDESLDDFQTRIGKATFAAEAAANPGKVGR